MTEDELIAAIAARVGATDAAPGALRVGIGDDAAVLEGGLVLSVDAVIEDVHFRRGWLSLEGIGFRGSAAALSDLAAMGASPRALLSSLVCSDAAEGEALMRGVANACERFGAPLVGGNVSRGERLSLHTTVVGHADAPWLRSGAQLGDTVFTSGPLGSAALGWRLLERGLGTGPFVGRWREPRPRLDLVGVIRPSACIDVSDGLCADLGRLCAASGVGARVELARIPVDEGHAAAATTNGLDPDELVLTGGEDYELIFTARASSVGTPIGTIQEGNAVVVVERDGGERENRGGHQHF